MLFDWYFDGDTPSSVFGGFRLSAPSARVFDALAGRVGAVVAGRNTYDDSNGFGGGSPHPAAALVVRATGRCRRAASARRWSRPASRTRSQWRSRSRAVGTSASWAAGS
jgi:hypothetical protein